METYTCQDYVYIIKPDGTAAIKDYKNTHTEPFALEIPAELDGHRVTSIASGAFSFCKNLNSVTVPAGVTRIQGEAFSDCYDLQNAELPEGLTFLGNRAFVCCKALERINLPRSLTRMDEAVFTSCYSLEEIIVAPDHPMLTYTDHMLIDKTRQILLKRPAAAPGDQVVVPEGIRQIAVGAFGYCSMLTRITLPESVTDIDHHAFNSCYNLTDINLPRGLQSLGGSAFKDCTALKHISIPGSISVLDYEIFSGCEELETIDLHTGLREISVRAFCECVSLKGITIPEGVTTIDKGAFYGCKNMTRTVLPASLSSIASYDPFDEDDAIVAGNMFANPAFNGCSSIHFVVTEGSYAHQWCREHFRPCTFTPGVTGNGNN